MPFLHVEDALLKARKASSLRLYVIYWFIAHYKLYYKSSYTRVVRVISSMLCNDYLQLSKFP